MYALVDCNSFFCSVEKVFHPGLEGKPVCVLSNNDGCIVALTPEAKKLGLHRGDPIFKVQDIVRKHGVTIFSNKSVDGDALSTSCFALGLDEGVKLIKSLDGIDALFVTDTYEIIDTRK